MKTTKKKSKKESGLKESGLIEIYCSRNGFNKELLKDPFFRRVIDKVIKTNDDYEKRKQKLNPDNK